MPQPDSNQETNGLHDSAIIQTTDTISRHSPERPQTMPDAAAPSNGEMPLILMLDEYQMQAARPAMQLSDEHQKLLHGAMGVASEAGEIAEAIKHHVFHGHELDEGNLKKELGDMLWYVSYICTVRGWLLSDIASRNITKLMRRYPQGFSSQASVERKVDIE